MFFCNHKGWRLLAHRWIDKGNWFSLKNNITRFTIMSIDSRQKNGDTHLLFVIKFNSVFMK